MKLELGVEDVAYSDPDAKGATTTGEVAEILEEKYHVMRVFAELHGQDISDAIAKDVSNSMDAILHGERISKIPLQSSMGHVESMFRDYLSEDEWQKTTGQAIAAAQNGVSHRFKDVQSGKSIRASSVASGKVSAADTKIVTKKTRGPRPAFIDTGLYSASFRAKVS